MKKLPVVCLALIVSALAGQSLAGPKVGGPNKKPTKAPTPGASVPSPAPSVAQSKAGPIEIFYKPSFEGADTTPLPSKEAASLGCLYQGNASNKYSIRLWNGKAFCERIATHNDSRDVTCSAGRTLIPDDKLPSVIKATANNVDQCLKTGEPVDVAASYAPASCTPGLVASKYVPTVNAGPDKCVKEIKTLFCHAPGAPDANVVGAPSQAQVDARTVTCPPKSTLVQEGETVYCKPTSS